MFSLRRAQRIWGNLRWECHMLPHSLQTCIKGVINLTSFSLVRRSWGKPISRFIYARCKKECLPKKKYILTRCSKIFLSCCLKLYSPRILYLLVYLLLIEKLLIDHQKEMLKTNSETKIGRCESEKGVMK